MIGSAVVSFGQNTFYFAHVVDGNAGGIWKTTIFLTNPEIGSGPSSGSITLTKDTGGANLTGAGTAMNVNWVDANGQPVGAGNVIPFQIAGGQTVKFTS